MRSSRPRKARAQDDKYLISHSEECSDVRISSFNVFKKSKKGGKDGRRKKKKRQFCAVSRDASQEPPDLPEHR
jgi:hypothetical protein